MTNALHTDKVFQAIIEATNQTSLNLDELTNIIISTGAYPVWIAPAINDGLLRISDASNGRMDNGRLLLDIGFHPEFKSLNITFEPKLMKYMFVYSSEDLAAS